MSAAIWLALSTVAFADAPAHDAPGEYLPTRSWDIQHLDLAVRVDPVQGTVAGTATHTLTPLGRRSQWLVLDQVGLDISAVRVDDSAVDGWTVGTGSLRIPMPESGAEHTVAVDYTARPVNGLHMRSPDRGDDAIEAYSQGEESDNRFWYPGWDFPNDRFTVETAVTAQEGLTALAIGTLVSSSPADDGWTTHRYRLDAPVPNYLVTIAVGEYVQREVSPGIDVYTIRGADPDEAAATLGVVAEMIPWVEARTGVPHPYPLYRQVVTQRFPYGAMENPTLVTFNTRYIHSADDPRPWSAEDVVMHELAHQWFGNLVTTYGWSDLWLNEGFATLLAFDWMADKHGPTYAADDAWGNRRAALWDPSPMSARAHTRVGKSQYSGQYVQGSTVLRWVRHLIGTEAFDAAVHDYLVRNAEGFVASADLRRAFETAGGQDLGWLFDQFVHGAGQPTVEVSWSHDEDVLTVDLSMEDAWDFPIDVLIGDAQGTQRRTVWLSEGGATLILDRDAAPDFVIVDPDAVVPAQIDVEQSADAWASALSSDDVGAQMATLYSLDEDGGDAIVPALIAYANGEAHVLPRARAVRALGTLGTSDATDALLALTAAPHAVLREAAVDALDEVPTTKAVTDALLRVARSDDDPRTAASAMAALATHDAARATSLARAGVRRDEPWMASLGADILADHGERGDLSLLIRATAPRNTSMVRGAAMDALVDIVLREDDTTLIDRVRHELAGALDDRDVRMRRTVIGALGRLPDSGAILRAWANTTTDPDFSERARTAALASARLGEPDGADEPEGDEEDALKTLQDRLDGISERLDRLESLR